MNILYKNLISFIWANEVPIYNSEPPDYDSERRGQQRVLDLSSNNKNE